MFEKFNQPYDHLTEKPGGLGLGLPISRLIVDHHGGLLWCDDSELGGASFLLILPLVGLEGSRDEQSPTWAAAS